MKGLAYRLKEKGWTQKEINKALRILGGSKKSKSKTILLLDKIVYWFALILAIVGNIILSVVLIPFLLALKNIHLYPVIIVIAFSFGLLFSILLRDIDGLDKRHHVIAGIFLPCLALINVYVMVNLANYLDKALKTTTTPHSPILISIIYVAFFILPYIFNLLTKKYENNILF